MSFINADIFYLAPLILLVACTVLLFAARRRRRMLQLLLGNGSEDRSAVRVSPGKRKFRALLLIAAMLLLLAAAARPFWSSQLVPYEPHGRDLMVLFDVSKSMRATDLAPSRLEHAKFLLRQLVAENQGDRFGLVAFAGNAFLACPLTSDKLAFEQYINELSTDSVPLGGTNLELALNIAQQAFQAAATGNRAIIVFTDGDELSGNSAKVVAELKQKQLPLFIIGLGSPEIGAPVPGDEGGVMRDRSGEVVTSKLNEVSLSRLALETGGVYVRSTVTDTGLNVIEQHIRRLESSEQQGGQRTVPEEKFPIFLILAAAAFLSYLVMSERPGETLARWRRRGGMTLLIATVLLSVSTATAAPENELADLPGTEKSAGEASNAENAENIPLPESPDELYNLARERQLAGDNQEYLPLYEAVLRNAENRPDLHARVLQNLGAAHHGDGLGGLAKAETEVQQQQLDPALKTLELAENQLKNAEELYGRSLAATPQNVDRALADNLQLLAEHRRQVEELKKKIEELKKLQEQAKQQIQQAQQNQQQQQNQQDQQSRQQQIEQAQNTVNQLQQKAQELNQQQLEEQSRKASEELSEAQKAEEKNDQEKVQQHLRRALEELGGGSSADQQENSEKGDQQQEQQQPQNERSEDEENAQNQPENSEAQPSAQQQQQPRDGELDQKTAEQLLEIMANEENKLRDEVKRYNRARQPRVEKDW